MRDKLIELLDEFYYTIASITRDDIENITRHLLENGVIVSTYRVGQTVWVIDNFRTFTKPIIESRKILSVQHYASGVNQYNCKDFSFYEQSIGKAVFLTKKEAEQALRKEDEGK